MGGKVFPTCSPIPSSEIDDIAKIVQDILHNEVSIVGSCYNKSPNAEYGDLDLMADLSQVMQYTSTSTPTLVKRHLTQLFKDNGYESEYNGSIVHILINNHQVDLMLVENAPKIRDFHRFAPSEYKGRHVHILLSHISKSKNLMWSPFNGLYTRTDGKKDKFISNDVGVVCKHLGLSSLQNFEQISAEVDPQLVINAKLDPNW